MKIWRYITKVENGELMFDCGPHEVQDDLVEQYVKSNAPSRMDFYDMGIIGHFFKTEESYNAFCCGFSFGRHHMEEFAKMKNMDFDSYLKEIDNEQK